MQFCVSKDRVEITEHDKLVNTLFNDLYCEQQTI